MKLSIITINYNDAPGLTKTLKSVADQHIPEDFHLEHIIVDGGSTDSSVDVIRNYEKLLMSIGGSLTNIGVSLKWISEKDKGVYNAMNKGIEIALGRRKVNAFNRSELVEDKHAQRSTERENKVGDHYIQILNSGDILASDDVLSRMASFTNSLILDGKDVEILYGNMLKAMPDGKLVRDNCGGPCVGDSFLYFYRGTLNHDCAWIKRDLFDRFGLYDEDMRICSDWKWYVVAIALGGIKPVYVNVDVTVFDMNGISESGGKNKAIIQKERREFLEEILPVSVLADYDRYAFQISQYEMLRKYHLWGIVYFVERVLFKLEKWNILKK